MAEWHIVYDREGKNIGTAPGFAKVSHKRQNCYYGMKKKNPATEAWKAEQIRLAKEANRELYVRRNALQGVRISEMAAEEARKRETPVWSPEYLAEMARLRQEKTMATRRKGYEPQKDHLAF